MSIKEKKVKVTITNRNVAYVRKNLLDKNGFIEVKNLTKGSKTLVTKICDVCGKELVQPYKNIINQRKDSNGKDYCFKCGNNKLEAKKRKSEAQKGKTRSKESVLKSSLAHIGNTHTEETKRKISEKVRATMKSKEWKEWIKKYNYENYSLNAYKKKYGEDDGLELYKKERLAKCPRSLEYWLVKTKGDADKAASLLADYQRRDENYFLQKYGSEEGAQKYKNFCEARARKNRKRYSNESVVFFKDLMKTLCLDDKYIYHSPDEFVMQLTEEEKKYANKSFMSLDFLDTKRKIVIEYDGDYWHSKKEQIKIDTKRDSILVSRGYIVLRILASKYKNDRDGVFNKIRGVYENYKY